MKKITLLACVMLFIGFQVATAQISKQSGEVVHTSLENVLLGSACDGILPNYQNINAAGNGGPSQSFEPANAAFDCEMADDFVVPGTGNAEVCQITIQGTYTLAPDPNGLVLFRIYEDNAGLPDNELFFDFVTLSTADPGATGTITVNPVGGPALTAGEKYWVSIQLDMDFDPFGQFFWSTATDGNDDPYVFQNPGDGFGTTCTSWASGMSCGIAGGTGPDLLMVVSFDEVLSVSENLKSQVSVYPVPSSDVINIKVPSTIEISDVIVYDLLGKNTGIVYNNGQIDISNLNRGVYMLTVKTAQGSITKKIVKK